MDALCIGMGVAFFAATWGLVKAFSRLQEGGPS